jgi:hypothetical protein
MAAVGYFQLGDYVESNIVSALCDGGVREPCADTCANTCRLNRKSPNAHITPTSLLPLVRLSEELAF